MGIALCMAWIMDTRQRHQHMRPGNAPPRPEKGSRPAVISPPAMIAAVSFTERKALAGGKLWVQQPMQRVGRLAKQAQRS